MMNMKDKTLDIMSVGLLPIYQHSKMLKKKNNIEEYENYHKLLKKNNSVDVYHKYLEFEEYMDNENDDDIEYKFFLCEL